MPPRPPRPSLRLLLALSLALAAPIAAAQECPQGMRPLPGGRFTLADGSAVAEVGALCLDQVEVTAGAFAACVQRGACQERGLRCGKTATYGDQGKAGHPVNCVTWTDADQFCRAQGKRLPTEAEWEWAARGRLRASTYPWGDAPPASRACWDGQGSTLGKGGRNETCAVGAFAEGASPDGLLDLGGNVREWTSSREGRERVVRGGSWGDSLPEFLAAGFRGMNAADQRSEITGFRCAASPGLLAEPRAVVRDIPLPPPPVLRQPARAAAPAAAAEGPAAARPPVAVRTEEELAEEEGTIVAPLEPVAAPPPAPVRVARPEPPRPPPAPAPPPRAAGRQSVEFGEIKIEKLSDSR